MNASRLRAMANDPMAFLNELVVPINGRGIRFAEAMAAFQRERFKQLIPALVDVAHGRKPAIQRHWIEATKGASKDSDLATLLLWLIAFSRRPLTIQVGAADADQAAEMRKAAGDVLRLNSWLADRVKIGNWRIECRATGAAADIIAADAAGSHGSRPDVVVLNELSHVQKQEFAETMLDNAAKVPSGVVIVATNSGHLGTWQRKWRDISTNSPDWSTHIYSQPAPWLDVRHIAEAEQRNSRARFRRLFWGEWSSGTGDALDSDDIAACVTQPGPMEGCERGFTFVGGLDLGIKNDHSALVVIGKQHDNRLRLALCQSWAPGLSGQVDLDAVKAGVLAASRRFRLHSTLYDPYQATLMAQQLIVEHVRMVETPFVGRTLNELASTLLEQFRSRNLDLYDDAELIRDLGRLSIIEKSYGHRLESTRNADGHADRATALSLAMLGAKSAPRTFSRPLKIIGMMGSIFQKWSPPA